MQTLDVISVNLWQMVVSLANLVLLFLIVKKFLYKPVKEMLIRRQAEIDGKYAAAKEAEQKANEDKLAYEEKLKTAQSEADRVIKSAVDIAAQREKEMLYDAKKKADAIVRQAEIDGELERKSAQEDIKKEIVEVSSLLAEKMLEREISEKDHQHLIDSFIESIGEQDASN